MGTGKSSLLQGGLVPGLRAEGRPVACDRNPAEEGLAGRLLGDLLTPSPEIPQGDPRSFVAQVRVARRRAGGAPPALVLDQVEDLLDQPRARAEVGTLLAASAQRLAGLPDSLCRWLLAYRQEFHGAVVRWLGDVLREARQRGDHTPSPAVDGLPHAFSGPERFHEWPLPPLGSAGPGAENRLGDAERMFLEAVEKPLELRDEAGERRYRWRFAAGDARRLARAFAEARVARPRSPLVPELQVVLAHFLESSPADPGGGAAQIQVPEDPGELIDRALEEHLRRALDAAFPASRTATSRTARTRALLPLRELADLQGRSADRLGQGLPAAVLTDAIGRHGDEVLERLAKARTRLVVAEEHAGTTRYSLSHDRLAELLVQLFEEETYSGLGVDIELLGLRRFVTLQSELFAAGETSQATTIPASRTIPRP